MIASKKSAKAFDKHVHTVAGRYAVVTKESVVKHIGIRTDGIGKVGGFFINPGSDM